MLLELLEKAKDQLIQSIPTLLHLNSKLSEPSSEKTDSRVC